MRLTSLALALAMLFASIAPALALDINRIDPGDILMVGRCDRIMAARWGS